MTTSPSPLSALISGIRQVLDAVEAMDANPAPDPNAPLDAARVAEVLGISRPSVYRLVRAGHLRALHVGKSVRIPVEEVESFRKKRTR